MIEEQQIKEVIKVKAKRYWRQKHDIKKKMESKRAPRNSKETICVPIQMNVEINSYDEFLIFGGINVVITNEITLISQLQINCIGEQKRHPTQFVINREHNRIDTQFDQIESGLIEFQFIIEICKRKQQQKYLELSNLIQEYYTHVQPLTQVKQKYLKMNKLSLINHEMEYQQFTQYVFSLINAKDKNSVYRYVIGKTNYLMEDVEMQYGGCTLGYLNILGIDEKLFSSLFLRRKKMNLRSNENDHMSLSIEAISSRIEENINERSVKVTIMTIDGFQLTFTEKLTRILSPFNNHQITNFDHVAYIIDIEIDADQLKQLLLYRQYLVSAHNTTSFEDLMFQNFETSFADVEYSIMSELFIQKHYQRIKSSQTNEQDSSSSFQ